MWEWHVSWVSEGINIYKIFLENFSRMEHLGELNINGAIVLKLLLEK
jgi:hypothetical protein